MAETSTHAPGRIARNTGLLYIRMLFMLAVGLYTSRVVLQALGVEDFGIYNVVGSIVAMFEFINGSMATSTSRFLTYQMGVDSKSEETSPSGRLHDVFSTAFIIHLGVATVVLLLGETLALWYVKEELVVPEAQRSTAVWLLQFSLLTAMVQVITVPFTSDIIAHEKMGAFAYISIYEVLMQLATAYIVMYLPTEKLVVYGSLLMLIKVSVCVIYAIYCRRRFEETRGRMILDRGLLKEMAKFAGWIMNGSLALVGYMQGLNILLNWFFGPVVNAARGLAVTIQSKVAAFCQNFQTAVIPQITKSYASGDLEYMHRLIINSSRYSLYLVLLLSLPLILETDYVLKIWLTVVPPWTATFIRWTLLVGLIDALRMPLNSSVHATGNLKVFQLIEGSLLLLIVPVAWLVLHFGGDPVSVFIVQFVIFIITQGARIRIVCPMIKMRTSTYVREVVGEFTKVCVVSIALPIVLWWSGPTSSDIVNFLIVCSVSLLSVGIVVYFMGLDKETRHKLNGKLKSIISKK